MQEQYLEMYPLAIIITIIHLIRKYLVLHGPERDSYMAYQSTRNIINWLVQAFVNATGYSY